MAVEFEVKGSRTSEYRFLPEQIEVDPNLNGRHEVPDIQWIIDSILQHGQLQPVTIRRTAGRPVLVAGFSRWRAVSEINKNKLTAKPLELRCAYTALNEKQAFLANIEENRVRNATTPMDDAYNLQRLINVYQMSEQEAADSFRTSLAWVKGRLKLIEATPEVERAIRSGKIRGTAAQAVAKLAKEHQRNLAKVAEEKGKVTAADIRKETGSPAKAPVQVCTSDAQVLTLADRIVTLLRGEHADMDEILKLAERYYRLRKPEVKG